MRTLFRSFQTYPLRYLFVCVLIICLLTLYPYNFLQRNNVRPEGDGLAFSLPGTAYTIRPHEALSYLYQFTFLLQVTPDEGEEVGRFARIMSSGRNVYDQNFSIGQWRSQLNVQFFNRDSKQFNELTIPDVFRKGKQSWIALTFNGTTVRCYVDGIKKAERRTGPMALTQWDSTYPIIFGTDPSGKQQWEGTIHSAAIFDRAFKAAELRHPDLIFRKYSSIIHYEFGRRAEQFIPSIGSDPDSVFIPAFYMPYNRSTLFDSFRIMGRQRLYIRDIVANVFFFLPIGFFSALALRRTVNGMVFVTILSMCFGMILSVSIESLQIFLPSRFSSLLDVVSNTLGAALGALVTVVIARSISRHEPGRT
ncbi:MAG TPA: VanZ family protein [Bacteroidota bacterium]|nr:VanZ family protein [Bacteroidota bacterium]